MDDIMEMITLKYYKLKDNIPMLEIITCNCNLISTRFLEGTEATIMYNMLKTKEAPMKSPKQLFTIFKESFPHHDESTFYTHTSNSIRLNMEPPIIIDEGQYIFTYNNEKEWSFETLKNYNKNIKQKGAK